MPGTAWPQPAPDEESGTGYPFAPGAATAAADGVAALASGALTDAVFYPAGVDDVLGLTILSAAPPDATLWFGTAEHPKLCSATFPAAAPPASLAVTDPYGRPAGLLVADPTLLQAAKAWPAGDHALAVPAALVASCVVPLPGSGLEGFVVGGQVVADAVWLVGGPGVAFTSPGAGQIRLDVVGDPLSTRRQCGPAGLFSTPNFVKTITVTDDLGNVTVTTPDAAGNWSLIAGSGLAADTVLRVTPGDGSTLTIAAVGKGIQS